MFYDHSGASLITYEPISVDSVVTGSFDTFGDAVLYFELTVTETVTVNIYTISDNDFDGYTLFDFTEYDNIILGGQDPAIFSVSYYNSLEDAKKAVRQRYKNGADWIKITATGGVLSVAKSGDNPQFTIEEVKEICQTAKDYGMHVAAHAHGDEGMQRAIIGGVKTIEHGTHMSDETMELMKKHDAYLVPTITAGKEVAEKAKIDGFYPAIVVPKALAVGPQIQGTFEKAYKKGVKIAFGTDAGVYPHGDNGKEFAFMVEAGMPEMEAIQSATITNAMLLQMENEIGQVKKGFFADIIAVNEDPTKNISTMENVVFVMKNGVIYKK